MVKEFWSKWHISLSSWFKDYLLSHWGNRCSKLRHRFNLLAAFLVSGLWHGANITFVLWGMTHRLLQIIEDTLHIKKKILSMTWFARVIVVFVLMSIALIFFRAQNVGDALYIIKHFCVGISNPKAYVTSGLYSFDMKPIALITYLFVYLTPLFVYDLPHPLWCDWFY